MTELLRHHPFFENKSIDSCVYLEQQGYCNANYLIIAEGKKYIVRKLLQTDTDRAFEFRVQQLAFAQGIAAEPLVLDEVKSLMIFAFVEGVHRETLSQADLEQLAFILTKLHAIRVESTPIPVHIENPNDAVAEACAYIAQTPKEYVLCHNDLNPKNILFGESIKLIDFEYAGVNDRYFDLACVCVEFELTSEEEQTFLSHYTKAYNEKKFDAYKTVYTALCKEWFENHCTTDIIQNIL